MCRHAPHAFCNGYRENKWQYPRGRRSMEVMTDKQYDGILQMIGMILDGCKDLNEAKRKIEALREGKKE